MLASVAGAHTILACRNMTACKLAAQGILRHHPGASVECLPLDLESLCSVRDFAAHLSSSQGVPRPVHVLVHNAGAQPSIVILVYYYFSVDPQCGCASNDFYYTLLY